MKTKTAGFIALFTLAATHLYAALIINVDTVNEEIWITGSDSGTPSEPQVDLYAVAWHEDGYVIDGNSEDDSVLMNSCFNETLFVGGFGLKNGKGSFQVMGDPAIATLSATSAKVSYAGNTQELKDYLANSHNSVFSLSAYGTGYNPVTFNVVPEPATATLTLLAGGVFFCMRRIRAHYKQI